MTKSQQVKRRRGRPHLEAPSIAIPLLLRLRPGEDDDLIAFFQGIPPRKRSAALKAALRAGGMPSVNLDDLAEDDAELAEGVEGFLM